MIMITVTLIDHGTWRVEVTNLEGDPVRNADGTLMGSTHSSPADTWYAVGQIIRKEPGRVAIVRDAGVTLADLVARRGEQIDATIRGAREN